MLITIIATLCLANSQCIERVVTNEATFMQCSGAMAIQVLPTWMASEGYTARGYRLEKWSCVLGGKREHI